MALYQQGCSVPFPNTAGGVQSWHRFQGVGQWDSPEKPPGPLCFAHLPPCDGGESDHCREEMKSLHRPGSLTGTRDPKPTLFPAKTQRLWQEQRARRGAGARGDVHGAQAGPSRPPHLRLILADLFRPYTRGPAKDPAFPSQGQREPLVLSAYSFLSHPRTFHIRCLPPRPLPLLPPSTTEHQLWGQAQPWGCIVKMHGPTLMEFDCNKETGSKQMMIENISK